MSKMSFGLCFLLALTIGVTGAQANTCKPIYDAKIEKLESRFVGSLATGGVAGGATGIALVFSSYAAAHNITTLGWVIMSPVFTIMGAVPGMLAGAAVGAGVGFLVYNENSILLSANIQEHIALPASPSFPSSIDDLNEVSNKKLKAEDPIMFALKKAKNKKIVPMDMDYESFKLLLSENVEEIFCPNGKAQTFRKVLRNIKGVVAGNS